MFCEQHLMWKQDKEWMKEVKKNKGIIVSMDGIQPDKGNEQYIWYETP